MVEDSEVMAEDDNLWPQPDRVGRQELEIVIGKISFSLSLSSYLDPSFSLPCYLSLLNPYIASAGYPDRIGRQKYEFIISKFSFLSFSLSTLSLSQFNFSK